VGDQRIKELMSELLSELQETEGVAENTITNARKLDADIQDLTNPDVDTSDYTVLDDAIALEASFAATHPMAEKIIREMINTLSKIGI